MSSFDVAVHVPEEFDGLVSQERLRFAALQALAVASPDPEAGVSVVVADDETVRDLNKRHRGLDEDTDVLAFSFTHQGEYYGDENEGRGPAEGFEFALPPGRRQTLGEVVVSYPQAARQASQAGHKLDRELDILVTHGVLHLLGLDHEEPDEEAAMKGLEVRVLARLPAET